MAASPYPAYGSGMHGLPDGGSALSGLRVGAAETVWLGMHVLPDGSFTLSGLRGRDAKTCMERLKRRRPDKRLRAIRQSVYGDIPAAPLISPLFPSTTYVPITDLGSSPPAFLHPAE